MSRVSSRDVEMADVDGDEVPSQHQTSPNENGNRSADGETASALAKSNSESHVDGESMTGIENEESNDGNPKPGDENGKSENSVGKVLVSVEEAEGDERVHNAERIDNAERVHIEERLHNGRRKPKRNGNSGGRADVDLIPGHLAKEKSFVAQDSEDKDKASQGKSNVNSMSDIRQSEMRHLDITTHGKSHTSLLNGQSSSITHNSLEQETQSSTPASRSADAERSSSSVQRTAPDEIKLERDMARLREVLNSVSSTAAQKILREMWRLFLFDPLDHDHVSFIIRAGWKNSNAEILEKVSRDGSIFTEAFIASACMKPEFRKQVLRRVSATELLQNVSETRLDRVASEKIRTAPRIKLHNWLASNERLGYELNDIIHDDPGETIEGAGPYRINPRDHPIPDEGKTRVMGNHPQTFPTGEIPRPPASSLGLANPNQDPLLAEQERNASTLNQRPSSLVCTTCKMIFPTYSGYLYHTGKKVCTKKPPTEPYKWLCENCMQGFTTKQGREYHKLKGVCEGEEPAAATPVPSSSGGGPSPQQTKIGYQSSTTQESPYGAPAVLQAGPSAQHTQLRSPPLGSYVNGSSPADATGYGIPGSYHNTPRDSAARPPRTQLEVVLTSPAKEKAKALPRPFDTPASSSSNVTPGSRKQAPRPESDIRGSPADLPPEKLREMNRMLQEADDRYADGQAAIDPSWTDEAKQAKLTSLKNANASRKSQIRKQFGVTLRMREKDKLAKKQREASGSGTGSPAPSSSRARVIPYHPDRNDTNSPAPAPAPSAVPQLPPIISGFSPINAPPRAAHNPGAPYSASPYGTPSISRNNSAPGGYSTSQNPPRASNQSGYGAPRASPSTIASQSSTTVPMQGPPRGPYNGLPSQDSSRDSTPNLNKRRHESSEHERRPNPRRYNQFDYTDLSSSSDHRSTSSHGPGLEMREVHSEDAAQAMSNRQRARDPQGGNDLADPLRRSGETASTNKRVSSASNTRASPIPIDSSDDEGSAASATRQAADAPRPSIENTSRARADEAESETERSRSRSHPAVNGSAPRHSGDDTGDEVEDLNAKKSTHPDGETVRAYTSGRMSEK